MINPHTGLVLSAVVSMGGFLGMGKKTQLVPWQSLEVTHEGNALVLNVLPQRLLQTSADAEGEAPRTASPPPAFAGSGRGGPDTPYGLLYNPAAEQTISEEVVRKDMRPPMPGMASGIQSIVKTDADQTMRVQVGPAWYLAHQDAEIAEH
jgi:hypothetical protein